MNNQRQETHKKVFKMLCSIPMTLVEIAIELEVDERTVRRWYSGHSLPNAMALIALGKLYEGKEDSQNPLF